MKQLSIDERLRLIGEIVEFLGKNGMKKYSIRVFPDWTIALLYGVQTIKTKKIEELLVYLKRTFRE